MASISIIHRPDQQLYHVLGDHPQDESVAIAKSFKDWNEVVDFLWSLDVRPGKSWTEADEEYREREIQLQEQLDAADWRRQQHEARDWAF